MSEGKKNNNKEGEKAPEEKNDKEEKASSSEEETQEVPDEEVRKLVSEMGGLTHDEPKTPEKRKPEPYVFSPSHYSPFSSGKKKADGKKVKSIEERQWPNHISSCNYLWIFSFDCQLGEELPNLYTRVKNRLALHLWFDLGNSSYLKWTNEGDYVQVRNQVFDALLGSQESQYITYITFIRATSPAVNWSGQFVIDLKNALLQIPGANIAAINQINDTLGAPNTQ